MMLCIVSALGGCLIENARIGLDERSNTNNGVVLLEQTQDGQRRLLSIERLAWALNVQPVKGKAP